MFTERGLDATLDEVARAAGVGVGTVYRRFPDKESLVAELFRDRIDALVTVAEQACADPDPWQGLVSYLEYAAAAMAGDTRPAAADDVRHLRQGSGLLRPRPDAPGDQQAGRSARRPPATCARTSRRPT